MSKEEKRLEVLDSQEAEDFKEIGSKFVGQLNVIDEKFGTANSTTIWLLFLCSLMASLPAKQREFVIKNTQFFLTHFPLHEFKNEEDMCSALKKLTKDFING